MSTIGDNLKILRKRYNLKQKELSELTGISVDYISKLEIGKKGNPSMETLNKLAEVLGCSVDDLTTGDAKKNKEEIFPEKFDEPQEARMFVRKHQVFAASDFDASKLTDEEIIEFANEVLGMMKLMTYKYKK